MQSLSRRIRESRAASLEFRLAPVHQHGPLYVYRLLWGLTQHEQALLGQPLAARDVVEHGLPYLLAVGVSPAARAVMAAGGARGEVGGAARAGHCGEAAGFVVACDSGAGPWRRWAGQAMCGRSRNVEGGGSECGMRRLSSGSGGVVVSLFAHAQAAMCSWVPFLQGCCSWPSPELVPVPVPAKVPPCARPAMLLPLPLLLDAPPA